MEVPAASLAVSGVEVLERGDRWPSCCQLPSMGGMVPGKDVLTAPSPDRGLELAEAQKEGRELRGAPLPRQHLSSCGWDLKADEGATRQRFRGRSVKCQDPETVTSPGGFRE